MRRFVQASIGSTVVAILLTLATTCGANMGAEEPGESTDPNFQLGKRALESQDWKRAIELLSKAVQGSPNNSDAHSMLGYAYRKIGNLDASFSQYGEALKLDPSNRHAHEYIGEAYLMTNNLPKAEQHLAALQELCSPTPCEEVKELKRAIDEYRKTKKK